MNFKITKQGSFFRFWTLFALLSAVIFVRYGLQINIPRELALIPIVIIAVFGNQTEIIAICFSLIPFHESLDFYYALILVITVYFFKFYNRIKINASFFLMLIFLVWELLHCFTADFSPLTFISSLAPLIALTIIVCSDLSESDFPFVVRVASIAAMVNCITMLIQIAWISRFNLLSFMLNLRRLGALSESSMDRLQITGGIVQTNSLGVICVIITSALILLRMSGKGKKSDIFIMLTLLIFGTFTASRTFLACLSLMIFLLILSRKGAKTKLKYIAIAVLALLIIFVIFSLFFPDQLEYYISRFFVEDITTGRDDLMVSYNEFITENPFVMFFGVGLQNFGDKLVNQYRIAGNVPHNSIQEIVVVWGVEGLLLIIILIFTLIYIAKKRNPSVKLLNYIPLIIVLFKSVAGQLLTSNYTILALGFAYLVMIQNLNNNVINENQ